MQKSLSSPGICKNKSAEESRDKSPTEWKSRLSNPSMRGDNLEIFVSRNTDESIGTFHLCPRVDPVSVGFRSREKPGGGNERLWSARHSLFPYACLIFRIFLLSCSALHLLSYALYLEPLSSQIYTAFPSLATPCIALIHFLHCLICIS